MSNIDDTKSNETTNEMSVVDRYFAADPFKKMESINNDPEFVDFDSMPIKNVSWDKDGTNLAGLYVNQLTLKGAGFKKRFVCELDLMFIDKTRHHVRLNKHEIEKLIRSLIEINNNMR